MNFDVFIRKDPSTGLKSLSFTLCVYAFILLVIASGLEMFKVIENTSILLEMYYANLGLYFGRRFSSAKSGLSLETPESSKV